MNGIKGLLLGVLFASEVMFLGHFISQKWKMYLLNYEYIRSFLFNFTITVFLALPYNIFLK